MSLFSNAKLLAEIGEITSRIYSTLVDKGRSKAEREARIKELEKEVSELKARMK